MSRPPEIPLIIWQGKTFYEEFSQELIINENTIPITTQLVDLSVYTSGRMQIRSSYDSPIVIAELSTANSKLLIQTTKLILTMPALETAVINLKKGVYDIELTNGSVIDGFCCGPIELYKEVTK